MNYSVCVFCRKGNSFFGFPDSSFEEPIARYSSVLGDGELLTVHQEHDLMTYTYIRRIENGFFGFVFAFNKIATDQVKTLFRVCENQIDSLIINGEIIQFNESGHIVFNDKLTRIKDDVAMKVIKNLRQSIDEGAHTFYQIDYSSYNKQDDDETIVNIDSMAEKAVILIKQNRTVYFLKNGNANSILVNSYAMILARLNEKINNYEKLIDELENTTESGSNKWMAIFIIQLLVTVAVVFYLYFLN